MKAKQMNYQSKRAVKRIDRCQSSNLSPPKKTSVKELIYMLRCPELFLAGCTSAEPVSASFRQNKYRQINLINRYNKYC
jgi:hypothetical protein